MQPPTTSSGTGPRRDRSAVGRGPRTGPALLLASPGIPVATALGTNKLAAVAGTAEDAIDALQAVRVDTILLDLEMPGAGGLRSIPLAFAGGLLCLVAVVLLVRLQPGFTRYDAEHPTP